MIKRKMVAFDTEFNHASEKDMGLISASLCLEGGSPESYWLRDPDQKQKFLARVEELRDHVFVGYSIQQAEARAFAALCLDPSEYQWRDLMLEWKWLRNCDNRYAYGKCMLNGRATYTVPPAKRVGKKASQEDIDEAKVINDEYLEDIRAEFDIGDDIVIQEVGWSMLDCQYFFSAIDASQYRVMASEKAEVRDGIILQSTDEELEQHRDRILEYNASDVADLLALADIMTEEMENVGRDEHFIALRGDFDHLSLNSSDISKVQLGIGEWAARLAKYGNRGIPLHEGRLRRLLEVVPKLQQEAIFEWNRDHPDTPLYRIGLSAKMLESRKNPATVSPYCKGTWTKDADFLENLIDTFCRECGLENYPRTRSGRPDTSRRVIDRYASGENLLKQYQRHQGHLTALRTYSANKQGKVEALDYIGSDGRQRPDFGPYGTQTARNGAKAKSLCFLGPHWLRVLCDPEPGMAIVECLSGDVKVLSESRGLINIKDVTLEDRIWDGETYVNHAGVINKGEKDVLYRNGIWATATHQFMGKSKEWVSHTESSEVARYEVPDMSWATVWVLFRSIPFRNIIAKGLQNLCACWGSLLDKVYRCR